MPLFIFNLTKRQQKIFVLVFLGVFLLLGVAACCLGVGAVQLLMG